jgi:hypothetical protein
MKITYNKTPLSICGDKTSARFQTSPTLLLPFVLFSSLFFTQNLIAQTYCASKGNSPWQEWITNVQIGSINNASQKEGYGNFTSQTTDLAKGIQYPLSITQGFSWAPDPSNQTQQGQAWIDFNQNGIFENTEVVASFTRTITTGSVVVPPSALNGATWMRIALKTNGLPSPCETFEKGEVEDYTVQITEGGNAIGKDTLKITSAVSPMTFTPDGNETVTLTIQNLGNAANDPNKLFRLSKGSSLGERITTRFSFSRISSDVPIGVAIPAKGTQTVNLTFKINGDFTDKLPLRVPNTLNPDGIHVGLSSVDGYQTPPFPIGTAPFKLIPQPTAILPSGDLSLTTTTPTVTYTGRIVNYSFTVKNNGTAPVNEVQVEAYRLSGPIGGGVLTVSKGTTVTYNGYDNFAFNPFVRGHWNVGTLAAGEEATCNVQVDGGVLFDTPDFEWIFTPFAQSIRINESNKNNDTVRIIARRIGGQNNQPDLTLANLTIPTPSVQQGQILSFKADFKNIGTGAASGNFTVKSYLSTDQTLSANDYADGTISTGNYAAGLTVNQVPAAMTVNSTLAAGQYYLILKIDADNQVAESNENNNIIVSTGLITVTGTTGGGGSDIALTMTATPSVYRSYTTQNFRITATNPGTTAFSNVKIKFTRPALTSSGGTKVASIGTFQDYCPGGIECSEWTIPTLAGGATATLDAPIFILAPTGAITATAALLSSTPTDNTTANNTASVTLNSANAPITQPLVVYKPTQLIPVVIQKISPTLADGEITMELESLIEKTIDFGISNAMGQTVLMQQIPIEKGMNKVGFDVLQLPQGLYFIQTNVGKGRNVPTKFIKL